MKYLFAIHIFRQVIKLWSFCSCSCNTLKEVAGTLQKWFPTVIFTGNIFFPIPVSLLFWSNHFSSLGGSFCLYIYKSNSNVGSQPCRCVLSGLFHSDLITSKSGNIPWSSKYHKYMRLTPDMQLFPPSVVLLTQTMCWQWRHLKVFSLPNFFSKMVRNRQLQDSSGRKITRRKCFLL